jgi:surface antigen
MGLFGRAGRHSSTDVDAGCAPRSATSRHSRVRRHVRLVLCVVIVGWLPVIAISATEAHASQTDCKSYAYACTPGYDATNTEGTWAWSHYGGQYALNANGYHNCTLYAAWRLEQNGMPDPGNWGNAVDWINHTSHNHTPAIGSIAWWGKEVGGGFGHVAYVDQMNGNQVHVIADNYVGRNSDGYTDAGWIPASSVDAFLHPHDQSGQYQEAFQANTGYLYTYSSASGGTNLQQGMKAGTSPSIAALAGGGYEEAFQANTGNLIVYGPGGATNLQQGMMPGTSPSIAASPSGGWEVAFQANTGYLYTYSSASGGTNLQQGMKAGTSPSIASS